MRSLAIAAAWAAALSACSAEVEGLAGDGGPPRRDAASSADGGPDATPTDATPADAAPTDAAPRDAATADASEDAGVVAPPCAPVILSEPDEDVTSAAIVADDTGWRIFRASDSPGVPNTRVLEQRVDAVGQTTMAAASAGVGSRVEAHHGGGGYAIVFGDTVIIGPTPELRFTPRSGGVIAYRRSADGSHALARWFQDRFVIDVLQRDGGMITLPSIAASRWQEVYSGALSSTQLAVVGTTTASGNPLAVGFYRIREANPAGTVPLPTVLASTDAARVVWHDPREQWLVAHSVQRPGTRYGDPHVTLLTRQGAQVLLQQPLGSWGAWYGAPIAVATTDAGYALAWQTAEDLGGGASGFNDYLLTAHVGADDAWTVESSAPPALAATGRVPPQVAWNPTTGAVGRLWIHRVGDFPPGSGYGQLIFQCGPR